MNARREFRHRAGSLAVGHAGARLERPPHGSRDAGRNVDRHWIWLSASGWLRQHSPDGSLIFQTDWDDLPHLFFYNSPNTYTIGLDPTYIERYDATLYADWVKITQGEVKHPGALIRTLFGAAYILSDLHITAFSIRQPATYSCTKCIATSSQ